MIIAFSFINDCLIYNGESVRSIAKPNGQERHYRVHWFKSQPASTKIFLALIGMHFYLKGCTNA